ncbi:MAG: transcription termination/antitermination protein NusG [bacterium]
MDIKSEIEPRWFIVNCSSGHENKVAEQIKQRVSVNNMSELITEVLVPTQEKIIIKDGKKKNIEEKVFPGYVIIKMIMNNDTWTLVRKSEGVTGFVGTAKKPTPLTEAEVDSIVNFSKVKQPQYSAKFEIGDAVKVVDGPFKDFVGTVKEINDAKGQVKILLTVFGRETPVMLDFLQIIRM